MDDVRAVLDAVGCERAVLWAGHEGTRLAVLFAATYPERTGALLLYDPSARGLWAPDYPWAPTEAEWAVELEEIAERWGDRDYLVSRGQAYCPTMADDERFIDWYVWYLRRSASPSEAVAFHRMSMAGDVRDVLPAVRASTLVLHRPVARDEAAYIASRIEGAQLTEVPGLVDGFSWVDAPAHGVHARGDAPVRGRRCRRTAARRPGPRHGPFHRHRRLDGAGERARRPGVAAPAPAPSCGGAPSPRTVSRETRSTRPAMASSQRSTALREPCARLLRRMEAVRPLGLEIRAGVHTGEVRAVGRERRRGSQSTSGARVAEAAAPGEVLVSSTVKDLVAGSGLEFEERGEHELKGVPGTWRLYAVADA